MNWMKKILIYILCIVFSNCSNDKDENSYYIISQPALPKNRAPSPFIYYGEYNFIFLDSSIFQYKLERGRYIDYCGTDIPPGQLKKINLDPNELKLLNKSSALQKLQEVANLNTFVSFSSLTDTIRNPLLKQAIHIFEEKRAYKYVIRLSTEEEISAVNSKITVENSKFSVTNVNKEIVPAQFEFQVISEECHQSILDSISQF